MRIAKNQLRQIIKEELTAVLKEDWRDVDINPTPYGPQTLGQAGEAIGKRVAKVGDDFRYDRALAGHIIDKGVDKIKGFGGTKDEGEASIDAHGNQVGFGVWDESNPPMTADELLKSDDRLAQATGPEDPELEAKLQAYGYYHRPGTPEGTYTSTRERGVRTPSHIERALGPLYNPGGY